MLESSKYAFEPIVWPSVPLDHTSSKNLGIYAVETIQRYVPGRKYIHWDGREYRYCKSASAISTAEACCFHGTGKIAYIAETATIPIGAKQLYIPATAHDAIAEDELIGGYMFCFGSMGDNDNSLFRGIVGNGASVANAAISIKLDFPTDIEIDSDNAYEIWENPYTNMAHPGDGYFAKLGPAVAYVPAAGYYFWCQYQGPCFQNPQPGVLTGGSGYQTGSFWRVDGSIEDADVAMATTVPQYSTSQYAGYVMMGSKDANGPLFYLQG